MSTINKMHALSGLFLSLVLILFIKPSVLGSLYASLLGRIILILVVLFFAMNNVTLGLLAALVIIIASNMFFHEGLDNMMSETGTTTTTTTNTVPSNISDVVANAKEKIQSKMNENNSVPVEENNGVDLETIKASVQSKPSSTLPVSPPASSEHVSPASTEPFTSMYAPF